MTQPEARLTRNIRRALETNFVGKIFIFKVWGNEWQMSGLPDLLGCIEGHFFGIETKVPASRDKVSGRQALVHDQIRAAGGKVAVCCSVMEALEFVNTEVLGGPDEWPHGYEGSD